MKSTKKALFMSCISLLLCLSMLVGTTFAWFTDSVTSGVNQIVAGNLDIEVNYKNSVTGSYVDLAGSESVFSQGLWEPGHTEFVTLKIENKGSLALKYKFLVTPVSETEGVNVSGEKFKLSDYLVFGSTAATETEPSYTRDSARAEVGTTMKLNQNALTQGGEIEANGAAQYITLVVYMPETVGNEANYLTGTTPPQINLSISVIATQKVSETDSFGNNYDALAPIDTSVKYSFSTVSFTPVAKDEAGNVTDQVIIKHADDNTTVHTQLNIPASRVDNGTASMSFLLKETEVPANLTVAATQGSKNYELSVTGMKEGSDVIIGKMFVGKGLTGVKFYHNITEEFTAVASAAEVDVHGEFYYNEDGFITFATTSFSPFSVLFDMPAAVSGQGTMGETYYTTADAAQAAANSGKDVYAYRDVASSEEGNEGEIEKTKGEQFFPLPAWIGEVGYKTLAEAAAACSENDTITLKGDIANAGSITLKPGVTLDGAKADGSKCKISGNSSLNVDAAGATIKDVVFENIHNSTAVPAEKCQSYGMPVGKIGDLSAIYAHGLTGSLTVTGCTFDNIDWEAIQITPNADASIVITDNIYKHTNAATSQLRYIHIEHIKASEMEAAPTLTALKITDNQFFNTAAPAGAQGESPICNVAVYNTQYASKYVFNGNYMENPENIDGIICGRVYPARSNENVDVDDLVPENAAKKVVGGAPTYHTLQEALDAGVDIELLRDADENATVSEKFNIQLQMKQFRIKSTITNNGSLYLMPETSEEVCTGTIINNGSLKLSSNSGWLGLHIVNNGKIEILGTGNGVCDFATIDNGANGIIAISGGKFTTAPDASWIAFGYQVELQDGVYNITKRTFASDGEAYAAGAVAKYTQKVTVNDESTTETVYCDTLSGSSNCTSTYPMILFKDVNENVVRSKALYVSADNHKITGSIEATGFGVYIYSGTADLNTLNCKALTLGKSATPINASIHGGLVSGAVTLYGTLNIDGDTTMSSSSSSFTLYKDAVANITSGTYKGYFDVKAGATLNISGGNFTRLPTASTPTLKNAGTINITGGTFKFDPSSYVVSGYHAVDNNNGTWTVVAD